MAHIVKTSPNTLTKKLSPTDVTQQSFASFKHDVQENAENLQELANIKNQTIQTDVKYTDSETGTNYKIYIKNGEVTLEEVQ